MAIDAGPIAAENQFPCRTLEARLIWSGLGFGFLVKLGHYEDLCLVKWGDGQHSAGKGGGGGGWEEQRGGVMW